MAGRRRLGWFVAIAYLLASMTPSLAIAVPFDPVDLPMHRADGLVAGHVHHHADSELAAHSHDAAMAGGCHDDQDKPDGRHAGCCGSALCFSAISPQAPIFMQFVAPRSRCESVPDLMGYDGTCSWHYRPPIA